MYSAKMKEIVESNGQRRDYGFIVRESDSGNETAEQGIEKGLYAELSQSFDDLFVVHHRIPFEHLVVHFSVKDSEHFRHANPYSSTALKPE